MSTKENVKYAGFWSRVLATIIDSIWLYGIVYLVLWLFTGNNPFGPDAKYNLFRIMVEWVCPMIVVLVFWIIKSATPAKMLLKMRIVDAITLEKTSPQRLLLRYLAYFISTIPLCLGLLWVGWDKKKQGWHDKIARTVVIRY